MQQRESLEITLALHVVPKSEQEQQETIELICQHMGFAKTFMPGDFGRARPLTE